VEQGWSLKPHPRNQTPVMLLMMGGEGPWRDASLGRL
jgi:hypothetical protein